MLLYGNRLRYSLVTKTGAAIYAGCGILTALFRLYGGMPVGVSFAIILMTIATPLIERYTVPSRFGGERNVG